MGVVSIELFIDEMLKKEKTFKGLMKTRSFS